MTAADDFDIEIRLLLEAIFEKYSYDFRGYSMASVKRRITLALGRFEARSVSQLQDRVLHDPEFFLKLVQFLTIPTSEMFRDPEYFLAMRTQVFPVLRTYPSLKFWIAGCSTGEEIYSFAIMLREEGLLEKTTIYATDINPVSLKKAEAGIFPMDRVRDYTLNYQKAGGAASFSDYYTLGYDSALIEKSLRKNVVFADHSLATDHVFSEVHVVSCRNVLIYFDRDLQDRAIGLFHESLSHRCFLGLGAKESLRFSKYDGLFEDYCRSEKIYRRK